MGTRPLITVTYLQYKKGKDLSTLQFVEDNSVRHSFRKMLVEGKIQNGDYIVNLNDTHYTTMTKESLGRLLSDMGYTKLPLENGSFTGPLPVQSIQ